jgi:hypothetical protein
LYVFNDINILKHFYFLIWSRGKFFLNISFYRNFLPLGMFTNDIFDSVLTFWNLHRIFSVICWDKNYYAFWDLTAFNKSWANFVLLRLKLNNTTTKYLLFSCVIKKLFIYKFMRILMWGAVVQKHIGIFLKTRRAEKKKKKRNSHLYILSTKKFQLNLSPFFWTDLVVREEYWKFLKFC